MLLDAVFKHLQGFFEYALINCSNENLPPWLLAVSPWPILCILAALILIAGLVVPYLVLPRLQRRKLVPMTDSKFQILNAVYMTAIVLGNLYIYFNTLMEFSRSSKAGTKLDLFNPDGISCYFFVLWFSVIMQIFQSFGDTAIAACLGQQIPIIEVVYMGLKMVNAWIAFQFYQRESALLTNIISLAEILGYSYIWLHRCGNAIARSISSTADARPIRSALSLFCCAFAGVFLIAYQDLDQRFLWWTLEYNMLSLLLIGLLLTDWRDFNVRIWFIVIVAIEFSVIGFYSVFTRDMDIADCTKGCIQDITAVKRLTTVPIESTPNGATTGTVGP